MKQPRSAYLCLATMLVIALLCAGLSGIKPGSKAVAGALAGSPSALPSALPTITLRPPVYLLPAETDQVFRVPARRIHSPASVNAATFTINYLPAGSQDIFGEPCYEWPAEAHAAFTYAASIWGAELNSGVPIVIEACWGNMDTYLGYSAAYSLMNFPGAPITNTAYSMTLADALASYDLYPAYADMYITYTGNDIANWYFGTDGQTPSNAYDFVTVVLHEICHGLNFGSEMTVSGGVASWGSVPNIYDRFAENGDGTPLLDFPNNSAQLAAQLMSNSVYFDGPNARAANGGERVDLFAPTTWMPASSYFHLGENFNFTVNALMTFSIGRGESIHDTGPVTRGILGDLGWEDITPPMPTPTRTQTGTPTQTGTLTSTPTATNTPTQTNTSTNTPIPANTSTPTSTATTCPAVHGYVRLNSAAGLGLANVEIYREVSSSTSLFATTNADGYYVGNGCGVPGMLYWPTLQGYRFEPLSRVYSMSDPDHDFVAFLETSQPFSVYLPLSIR